MPVTITFAQLEALKACKDQRELFKVSPFDSLEALTAAYAGRSRPTAEYDRARASAWAGYYRAKAAVLAGGADVAEESSE